MTSEREFLEQRYQIICQRMAQPNKYDVDAQGRFYITYQPDTNLDYAMMLEGWLIEKLLNEVEEGRVQKALVSWHKKLYELWCEHCNYYRDMKMAYNEWASLPWSFRQEIPEPPQPPELEVKDLKGSIWVVDQRILDVLLDMQTRLTKWLNNP